MHPGFFFFLMRQIGQRSTVSFDDFRTLIRLPAALSRWPTCLHMLYRSLSCNCNKFQRLYISYIYVQETLEEWSANESA